MKDRNIIQIGGILFFIGFILITISWNYSYPISFSSINEESLFQYYPSLWLGLITCMIGIFLIGFFSKNKIIQATCSSIFPLLLYVPYYYYSYLPSPDCGFSRSAFQIFHITGLNSVAIPYFEFPISFSLNEMIHLTTALDEKGISFVCFTLYGILLGLFLYLFFLKLKKSFNQNNQLIPYMSVIIYFVGIFPFLMYQWVPQTLALVYFFLLIMIINYIISDLDEIKWIIIFILVFISLVLTHPFISVFFILFFGFLAIKKRYLLPIFLFIFSIYIIYTLYYTLSNFSSYIKAFETAIQYIGKEYSAMISKSVKETEGIISQFISLFNRITFPMIWILSAIGTVFLFLKRKIDFVLIALGLAGGIYLVVGGVFDILGTRSTQILLIPIAIGFMFFITKWRKSTIVLIVVILILAIFGPMRVAYNYTHFQTYEDVNACNFLVNNVTMEEVPKLAVHQVNYAYFTNMYIYLRNTYPTVIRPGQSGFFNIFNRSIDKNNYVIYNPNLGKEILNCGITKDQFSILLMELKMNNKIYDSGTTFIINGAL